MYMSINQCSALLAFLCPGARGDIKKLVHNNYICKSPNMAGFYFLKR